MITWSAPAAISYGTPLSATQLNATSDVPGTFAYSPAAGAMLAPGTQTLSVTFTPTDLANYATVSVFRTLIVNAPWGHKSTVAPAAANYDLALSNGTAYVTYENAGNIYVSSKAFADAAWSSPQLVDVGTGPSIAVGTGGLKVAYMKDLNISVASYGGSNWSSINLGSVDVSFRVMLRVDGSGAFYLLSEGSTPGNLNSWGGSFDLSVNNGFGWSAFTNLVQGHYPATGRAPSNTYSQAVLATTEGITGYKLVFKAYDHTASGYNVGYPKTVATIGFYPNNFTRYVGIEKTLTISPGAIAASSGSGMLGYVFDGLSYIDIFDGSAWSGATSLGVSTAVSVSAINGPFAVYANNTTGTLRQYDGATSAEISSADAPITVGSAPLLDAVPGSQHLVFLDGSTALTYLSTAVPGKVTPAVIWATPAAITYGTGLSADQLNATADVAGTFTYTPALGTTLSSGASQTLSLSFTPSDATSYYATTARVTLNVNQLPSTLSWAVPAAITYGTALSTAQLNVTANVPGTFAYMPVAGTVLLPGVNQTLRVTFTPTDSNYTPATATQTISVNKAPLTATADSLSRVYGSTNPPLTITYIGFVNNDTVSSITQPSAATSATLTSPAYAYPIVLTGGYGGSNYALTLVSGMLTIGKAPLTATADNQTRLFGAANPAFTISYQGWVNGDTVAALTAAPIAATTATQASTLGVYPITLTGGSAANYTLRLQDGVLTVNYPEAYTFATLAGQP